MPLTTWIKFLRRKCKKKKKKEWFGEQGPKCCWTAFAFAFAQRTYWSSSAYQRCVSRRSSAELSPPLTALSLNVLHASLRKAVHLLLMETKWIILWPCVCVWYFKQYSEQSWLPWTLSFQGQRMPVWWGTHPCPSLHSPPSHLAERPLSNLASVTQFPCHTFGGNHLIWCVHVLCEYGNVCLLVWLGEITHLSVHLLRRLNCWWRLY